MALNQYLTDTQLLCHDTNGVFATTSAYTTWINEARQWVAGECQCVRQLLIVPTVAAQETYGFPSGVAASGVGQTLGIVAISMPWGAAGSIKPTLDRCAWSEFQAKYRGRGGQTSGNPAVWAQYGDTANANVYFYPIPQQAYNSEWDTFCNVLPLTSDSSPEYIPFPFTSLVKYYAAHLAALNAQKFEAADKYMEMYMRNAARARKVSSPLFMPSAYRR